MSAPDPAVPAPAWRLWLPYLLDLAGPFVAFAVVQAFGAPGAWALTAAGLAAGASTAVNSLRRKGLDRLGLLVLLELLVSIALALWVRDGRLLLVRPSFYTAAAAVYLAASTAVGRPLSYAGSRQIAARHGPARLAACDRAWAGSAEFRRTHAAVTLAFAAALAADSVLRVVIAFRYPVERAAWLSNVPHVTAMVLMIATSAAAGRRFARLVDAWM